MFATAFLKLKGVVVIASIFLIGVQHSASQSPTQLTELIDRLPRCSVLRTELEHGHHAHGVSRPYVARMQESGIERALFEFQAVLHKGRPTDVQITRRLYFRKFDTPNSQVSDNADLAMLAARLQPELDESALARVSKAPILRGFREFPRLPNFRRLKKLESSVEFMASPWFEEKNVYWFASAKSLDPLTQAVLRSDAIETRILLESRRFSKSEINGALFLAASNRYDNRAVIELSIQAGADPNSRRTDGSTPLMDAVGHPCNIPPLLEGGADPSLQDKWGRTALGIANWPRNKNTVAISLLQEAGATEK